MAPFPPLAAASVVRQALVPMVAGYLILMAALALGLWRMYRSGAGQRPGRPQAAQPPGQAEARPPPGQPEASSPAAVPPPGQPAARPRSGRAVMARLVISTVVGGYLLLMAIVVAYYYGVAKVGGSFLESAFTGTALLIGLTTPLFAAASWLTERSWRRRGHPADPSPPRRP
jgi:hypothetical protein